MLRHAALSHRDADSTQRPVKRQRLDAPEQPQQEVEQIEHILYVRWHGHQGQSKLNKLPLRGLEQLDALKDLPKELIDSHYSSSSQFPEYFTSTDYIRFTPKVECLALPGYIVRTEVRLVLRYGGWEYTILKQDMSRQPAADQEQTIRVMTAEFMGSDPLMAALGLRISLIAYPVVALRKAFLEELHERLLAAPEQFKGIL